MPTLTTSYTSVENLLRVLPDIGSVTTLASAHLTFFIGQAEAIINGRISQRYALPLSAVPQQLESVATDIAIYYLLAKRLYTGKQLEASPWPDRYKEALETLGEIAEGAITLTDTAGTVLAGRSDIAQVYCLDATTRVLTGDLRWVPLGEIRLGDDLLSFDEYPPGARCHRKLLPAVVTAVDRIVQPCFRIAFADGRCVTASFRHRWLTRQAHCDIWRWIETDALKPGDSRIRDIGCPWEPDNSSGAGYLAGVFDGEACFIAGKGNPGFRISFAQLPGLVMDHTRRLLTEREFRLSPVRAKLRGVQEFDICGVYECLRFLGQIRPVRLLARVPQWLSGRSPRMFKRHALVNGLTYLGEREVVAIGTSTQTLFAEGLFSHNSTTKGFLPTFWEGNVADAFVDPDKLEDEANRRDLTLRDRLL
jgi:phage gp36-like protein